MSKEQCGQVTAASPLGDEIVPSLAEEPAGQGAAVKGLILRFTRTLFVDYSCVAHPVMQGSLLVVHPQHD
jgi:hypothetical protein